MSMSTRRYMFKNSAEIFAYIKKEDVKLVDVRFTDLPGIQHHFNVPIESFDEAVFTDGLMFDGSSIRGFQSIHESDMKLLPVPESAFLDPYRKEKTLVILFSVHNLKLHTRVERFSHSLIETSQGDFFAKKIIIATDAATATQLLDIGDGTSMAGCITWYHTSEINPSGTGYLIVDGQGRGPVINSVVISDISPSYAPPGAHLISTTTPLNTTESEVRRHLALLWLSDTRDWPLIAEKS